MNTTDKMLETLHGMTKKQLVTLILTLSNEFYYPEDERVRHLQELADYRIEFDKRNK